MKKIYCDEAGFTGGALLDSTQPYFVYSSVDVEEDNAALILATAKSTFKLQMPEIKGSRLTKSVNGKMAALDILEQCISNARLVYVHKISALAGKFYEYMFEFASDSHNYSDKLYMIEFHRFIANILSNHFIVKKDITTINLMKNFEDALRKRNYKIIEEHLRFIIRSKQAPVIIKQIARLCLSQRRETLQEWKALEIQPMGKWILDLTTTSLEDLLTYWGSNNEILEVYCDDSKPILASLDWFDAHIGNTSRSTFNFGGRDVTIGYNLSQSIQSISSSGSASMQIADVFASSLAYALNNPEDEFSKKCLNICQHNISANSMKADSREIDILTKAEFINKSILETMIERKRSHKSMFKNLNQEIHSLILFTQQDELFPNG